MSLPEMSRKAKVLVWSVAGLGLLALGGGVALLLTALLAFDTDRDLADFSSPDEARAFTSAHLPVPLPANAVIESLRYQRWTDWHLTAQVRLSSAAALEQYVEQAKRRRATNDEYCSAAEPEGGARYFLGDVSACGTIRRASPRALNIVCNTR